MEDDTRSGVPGHFVPGPSRPAMNDATGDRRCGSLRLIRDGTGCPRKIGSAVLRSRESP